jgi:RNA polymerase sigma-70 factor (ECF subfamily)
MTAVALTLDSGLSRLRFAVHSPAPADGVVKPVAKGRIDALRQRDPDAWRRLFDDEMPAIHQYAASRLGRDLADDVSAQVFEAAWQHAESLQDRGLPPRAWLFGIARNVVSSHRRWLVRRPPMLTLEGWDRPVEDLDPSLIDLAAAVQRLARAQAEVVTLRFVHGLSLVETAEALGTSVDSVKSRQARALKSLRDILDPTAASESLARSDTVTRRHDPGRQR